MHGSDTDADPFGNAELHGTKCVISVHERVNQIVHHHEPAAGPQVVGVAVPDVDEGRNVMIPVQEDELLLSEHYEYSVTQFIHLGDGEHKCPESCWTVEVRGIAHRVGEAILLDDIGHFRQGSCCPHDAEQAKDGTPQCQGWSKVESGSLLH